MSVLKRAVVGLIVMALGLLIAAPTASAAPRPLPENYNFLAGVPHELANPGTSLPGSNDFSCKPRAAHQRPVVLVHGTGGAKTTNWGAYVPMLKNRGYCVFALTYGATKNAPWPFTAIGGLGRQEESAAELGLFIDKVLASTGASSVDLIGHSQGTYMPTYYLKQLGGAGKVTKYISLAPLWKGTGSVSPALAQVTRGFGDIDIPFCGGCAGMMPGSDLHEKIWAGGSPYVQGIEYTNIMTRYDEAVIPYTAGYVRGRPGETVKNIVVQDTCAQDYSDHAAIAGSKRAAFMVLNALDPANPVRVPCMFVPPITG